MSFEYFIKRDDEVYGPCSINEIAQLIEKQKVSISDNYSLSEDGPWKRLAELPQLNSNDRLANSASEADAVDQAKSKTSPKDGESILSNDLRIKYASAIAKQDTLWLDFVAFFAALVFFGIVHELIIGLLEDGVVKIILSVLIFLFTFGLVFGWLDDWKNKKINTIDNEYSDDLLEAEYREIQAKKKFLYAGVMAIVVAAAALFIFSKDVQQVVKNSLLEIANGAQCEVLHQSANYTSFVINEQWDYGYLVEGAIKNIGEEGQVNVVATLSSSEGIFERVQSFSVAANEELSVDYQFPEPTLNSTNVQYAIRCSPG